MWKEFSRLGRGEREPKRIPLARSLFEYETSEAHHSSGRSFRFILHRNLICMGIPISLHHRLGNSNVFYATLFLLLGRRFLLRNHLPMFWAGGEQGNKHVADRTDCSSACNFLNVLRVRTDQVFLEPPSILENYFVRVTKQLLIGLQPFLQQLLVFFGVGFQALL